MCKLSPVFPGFHCIPGETCNDPKTKAALVSVVYIGMKLNIKRVSGSSAEVFSLFYLLVLEIFLMVLVCYCDILDVRYVLC